MHIHIFIETDDTTTTSSSGSSGSSASSGTPLALFEIKKVDVRELVIESTTGDFKLELAEFLMKGLRIRGNNFELASLSMGSNLVVLMEGRADPSIKMPHGSSDKVAQFQIDKIKNWIDQGALDN